MNQYNIGDIVQVHLQSGVVGEFKYAGYSKSINDRIGFVKSVRRNNGNSYICFIEWFDNDKVPIWIDSKHLRFPLNE